MKPEALVLIPGLMCDQAMWQAQIASFSTRVPIQIADHGELDSLVAMAERVLETAPKSFALAGHSMGGRVALEVVRLVSQQAPERITHLGLLDTGCHALPAGEAGERERATRQVFLMQAQKEGVAAMARNWVKGMVHPSRLTDAPLINGIVQMFARKSVKVFSAQIRALLARPQAYPLLSGIRCPTLVLCGTEDLNSPPAVNREMAAAIPNSQLVIIEQCGHMSMMEKPSDVNTALERWLSR